MCLDFRPQACRCGDARFPGQSLRKFQPARQARSRGNHCCNPGATNQLPASASRRIGHVQQQFVAQTIAPTGVVTRSAGSAGCGSLHREAASCRFRLRSAFEVPGNATIGYNSARQTHRRRGSFRPVGGLRSRQRTSTDMHQSARGTHGGKKSVTNPGNFGNLTHVSSVPTSGLRPVCPPWACMDPFSRLRMSAGF